MQLALTGRAALQAVIGSHQRRLRQLEAFDLRALLLCPVEIGGEGQQGFVDTDTAHTGAAAERGVVNLDLAHGNAPGCDV